MTRGSLVAALVALPLFAAPSAAADPYRVTLVPFKLEAKVEGTFEPPALGEVRIEPKRWSQFVVESVVPHGSRVGKGDVVVRIETDKLDEQIHDLEMGSRLADLAHGLLERQLTLTQKATPLQLELARRVRQITAEDRADYETKEAELARAFNDMRLKFAEFSRENAEEELAQLEQMYEQDELTEETEEIVLKRHRFEAEAARFMETLARAEHERVATFALPRRLESIRRADAFAALDLEQAEGGLPIALDKLRLELEKSRNDRRKATENLAELKADRALLPVTAPLDGVVYYGKWRNGKWTDSDTAAARLRRGGQIEPRDTVITIMGTGRLSLRAAVPEKDLARVPVDAVARIVPKAFPDVRLAGKVRSVSPVPVAAGRFETVIDLVEEHPRLVAGMEAEIRVIAEQKPEALAVPKKAVFTADTPAEERYVYVAAGDGKPAVKRTVTVGRSNDELVEVVAGLAVGDEILLEKPADKSTPKPTQATKEQPAPVKAEAKSEPKTQSAPEPAKPAATDAATPTADAAKPAEPEKK